MALMPRRLRPFRAARSDVAAQLPFAVADARAQEKMPISQCRPFRRVAAAIMFDAALCLMPPPEICVARLSPILMRREALLMHSAEERQQPSVWLL